MPLQPKHYKALELFEEGVLSIKEIADACKIPLDSMYDLFEGDTHKVGETAALFREELNKITARSHTRIKHILKDNKKIALYLMNDRLKVLKTKKPTKEVSLEIAKIVAVLSKATPSVEVGSLHITRGMTPEELRNEFKRLAAIAKDALDGRRIQRFDAGEQGDIPESPE